jgi:class 3 adenylate cyclase/tetratricopeptide (TPR) repeat protein
MDIAEWLRRLDLAQYVEAFAANAIDWSVLPSLTADDLKDIGVAAVGHRRKLLNAIAALSEPAAATDPAGTASAPPPQSTVVSGAERRQLTIMFCDLVGSTALSARLDPEDLREVYGAYHTAVAEEVGRFGGFVAKYMGDGALSYFGYPEAHEDDAERAVRTGLALADRVARLKTHARLESRIGVATGLVVVGDLIGQGEAQERGIVGETPNLAARMQELAPPGGVVIVEGTRRLIGNLFELRDLGAVAVKGFAAPVAVWQALRPSAVESRFEALRAGALTPLVGRNEELEVLLRRWQRVTAGDGQVVLLSGDPGIGKSRLTAALRERLEREPHSRVRYFCSPHHQDSALHPFVAQLERAAGFAHDDSADVRLDKLTALIAPGARDRDEVILIADLLSLLPSGAAELDLTPQRKREKLLAALLHQLDALARQQPVLMVVEDLHWIDPSSREFLDLTVERAASLPVLLILTFRPEFQPPWSGLPQVTALTLNRLDRPSGAAMVEGIAGNRKLPDALAAEIVERADGVPLFVEELTRAVIEAGPGGETLAGAAPLSSSGVPPALHASLVARLDRLGPAAREIAQIGAVLGREFSYELIAQVAQPHRAEADLQAALGALTGAGLLFCRGVAPRSSYLFKHALIQDAAYETLLRARRQELHRAAAQKIAAEFPALAEAQPELIARHWSETGDAERAYAAWRKAGEIARARNAFIEAQAAYRHALDRLAMTPPSLGRDTTELELLIATSQMIAVTKGYTSSDRVEINARAEALAAKTGNLGHLAEQIFGSWTALVRAGNYPSAMALADRLLDIARRDGSAFTRGLAGSAQSNTRFLTGDLPGAEEHFISGEAFLSDRGLRRYFVAAITISYAGWNAEITGRADEARARMRRAIAAIEDDAFARALVQWGSSCLHVMLREPEQAAMLAAQAIATSAEHGFRYAGELARISHGWAQAQLGHLEKAASLIGEALAANRVNGNLIAVPAFLTWLAEAQALGGAPTESLRTLDEALTVNPDERFYRPETLRVRGEIRRQQGEEELAEADFNEAIALAQEMSAKAWKLRAATSLARLCRDQGRRAEARDLLAPVYGLFTEGFDTLDLKDAAALLAELRPAAPEREARDTAPAS